MLAKFSVRKPFTVVVAVLLVLILGFVSFTEMTTDLLPSLDIPYAVVVTSYPGASPEEVEQVVTRPVEQAMATISNVENITSTSSENVSMVVLEFNDDVNMDAITIDIREGLDAITGYWEDGIGAPLIMKINPDMLPVMVAAVDADGMSTAEISSYVEQKIIPRLESVEGVASVSASGLLEKQVNVVLRQEKIDAVNDKLKGAINDKMDEAEQKIKDAKKDLKKGKTELQEKTDAYNKGIEQGEQGILEGRLKLLQGEIEMAQGEKELASKEAEWKKAKEELTAKETQLKASETELQKKETEASEAMKQLEEAEKKLPSQLEELKESKDGLAAAIETAQNNDALPAAQKDILVAELTKKLEPLEQGIAQMEAAIENLPVQKEQLEAGITQLEAARKQLEEGKTALTEAKAQLKSGEKALSQARTRIIQGKSGIESGKAALSEKQEELNKTKNTAGEKLSEASAELKAGEKELASQLEQFDEKREEALEAADIGDTLTVDMIKGILQAENFSMPAGYVTEEGIDYLVRVGDKLDNTDDIKKLILFDPDMEGVEPVTLSDVADVFWTDNSGEIYAKINGNDGVIISMQKQTTYSTAEVAERVNQRFQEIMDDNADVHVTSLMDQGMYINLVVNSVLSNLLMGGLLAILILWLFLQDLKPTFIIACSIPLSVVFAIVLMYFSGVTLNIISLSGLAVGVGMLVDNSVVVIENIYRLRSKGISAIKAAVSGAVQVAGAIVSSTLTTVCVFLPIVFVKGLTRQLFTDMALTIGYSLLASLIVALTLVPTMSSSLLKNTKEKRHRFLERFIQGYEFLIRKALKIKPLVILLAIGILGLSAFMAVKNGTALFPAMDSTQLSITMQMPEGAAYEETTAMADKVAERISSVEDVETVGAILSGGSSMMGMGGSSGKSDSASFYVILKEKKRISSIEAGRRIEQECRDLNCTVTANTSSMDMSALGGTGIELQIRGPELDTLQKLASEAADKLKGIKGIGEVFDGMEDPTPELRVTVDKEKAMKKGLTVAQVYQELSKAVAEGKSATKLSQDGNEYSIVTEDENSSGRTREDIRNYIIETKDKEGKKLEVKLKDIAAFSDEKSLSSIRREAQQRYITVSASLKEGYNIGLVSTDVEKAFHNFTPPAGYELKFTGENESINDALGELTKMLLLALAFIYFIMVAQFQSLLSPFIVMFTIPLAFTGGFLGLWFTGKEVSVVAMIGFVMLSGIVVNNGIVLVDYINQLRRDGTGKKEAIVEAGKTRMRPILMTALTTILGLSTMALGVGMGSDMMQPVAIVTIGGLLYATFTTLFVIPVLYDLFNRRQIRVVKDKELELVEEKH